MTTTVNNAIVKQHTSDAHKGEKEDRVEFPKDEVHSSLLMAMQMLVSPHGCCMTWQSDTDDLMHHILAALMSVFWQPLLLLIVILLTFQTKILVPWTLSVQH